MITLADINKLCTAHVEAAKECEHAGNTSGAIQLRSVANLLGRMLGPLEHDTLKVITPVSTDNRISEFALGRLRSLRDVYESATNALSEELEKLANGERREAPAKTAEEWRTRANANAAAHSPVVDGDSIVACTCGVKFDPETFNHTYVAHIAEAIRPIPHPDDRDTQPDQKPARPDKIRVERGDWQRAAGSNTCGTCDCVYYDHAKMRGYEWLTRLCNGRLVKL